MKSARKLRADMISRPQNDLRHTGHIGYDGAMFGDVAFIGNNYDKLPVKVVSPCKSLHLLQNCSSHLTNFYLATQGSVSLKMLAMQFPIRVGPKLRKRTHGQYWWQSDTF